MTLITRRLLPLAGSILLTLSITATAQTAAPLAHGIAIANMDTSDRKSVV